MRQVDSEYISALAGLNRRAPLLAATMTLAMVSLAGIPPLAGFFGKFLLLKSVIEQGPRHAAYYCLAFTALAGVVISLYYYFGVVRAIYWSRDVPDISPIQISHPIRVSIYGCLAGMFLLGIYPNSALKLSSDAADSLRREPPHAVGAAHSNAGLTSQKRTSSDE